MGTRLELQSKLEEILGSRNVYFEPPSNLKLTYPCIIYELKKYDLVHTDNTIYKLKTAYDITVIERSPVSQFTMPILSLPYCTFDRHFVSDTLHHNTFTIYF